MLLLLLRKIWAINSPQKNNRRVLTEEKTVEQFENSFSTLSVPFGQFLVNGAMSLRRWSDEKWK